MKITYSHFCLSSTKNSQLNLDKSYKFNMFKMDNQIGLNSYT